MNQRLFLSIFLFFFLAQLGWAQDSLVTSVDTATRVILIPPPPVVEVEDFEVKTQANSVVFAAEQLTGVASLKVNGEETNLNFENGIAAFATDLDATGGLYLFETADKHSLYHLSQAGDSPRVKKIPLWLSIIPPLMAILLALIFREVLIALFVGIFSGAFIANGLRLDIITPFFKTVEHYVLNALNDGGHLSIIVFSLLIGGMVAIISRNGGMAGVVASLARYARTARSSQFITWVLGVAIFFDDYANTLIVGNTMRSVTDKFRISREKLAYIVDSTAAPVAAVAFITTWIGAELSYIEDGISTLENFSASATPYSIFLSSLKYSFYPILTLIFILIIIYTGRDFGPMYKAEHRARTTGEVSRKTELETEEVEDLSPVKGAPLRWYNAAIPVFTVIIVTILGLVSTGMESVAASLELNTVSWGAVWSGMTAENPTFFMKLGTLIGSSDSYIALLWASLSGVAVASLLTISQGIMKLNDTINTLITGIKAMLPAIMILTLAWSLAITTEELHTANFLTSILVGNISPYLMPVITFVLAAAIAFSTGSSWSTMAILYPIAIPTTWAVCGAQGLDPELSMELLYNVISVVLAASVLGDHCSPISDTTILSSLATDCKHIDHVRTQLPYALTVGGVSILAGGLSTLLGGGWLVSLVLVITSIGILFTVVRILGQKVD